MRRKWLITALLLLSAALFSCDNSDDGNNNDGNNGQPQAEGTINPETGGAVTTPDSAASVVFYPDDSGNPDPPVTITIAQATEEDVTLGDETPVGPIYHIFSDYDGLFHRPVMVEMSYDPALVEGHELQLRVVSQGELSTVWEELNLCSVDPERHTVSGYTRHFSYFTIVVGEEPLVNLYGDPQGGVPTGDWTYSAYDLEYDPSLVPPGAVYTVEGHADGSLQMNADSTYHFAISELTMDLTVTVMGYLTVLEQHLEFQDVQSGTWQQVDDITINMTVTESEQGLEGVTVPYTYTVRNDTLLLFNDLESDVEGYESLGRLVTILTRGE